MRRAALFAALVFSTAPALAAGQPISSVDVAVGPKLREKAETYGERDIARLQAELEADVERALARENRLAPDGSRLELVLADATATRPTFKELGDRPGLAFESVALGGATIEGALVAPDGTRTPVRYRWYEHDLRNNVGATTWSDTEIAFDRFARRVAKGDLPNQD